MSSDVVRHILQAEPDAKQVLLSSVAATQKRNRFLSRTWEKTDFIYIGFMAVMHGLCLLAPATFSWPMVALFFASYFVTGCASLSALPRTFVGSSRSPAARSFDDPSLDWSAPSIMVLIVMLMSQCGADFK